MELGVCAWLARVLVLSPSTPRGDEGGALPDCGEGDGATAAGAGACLPPACVCACVGGEGCVAACLGDRNTRTPGTSCPGHGTWIRNRGTHPRGSGAPPPPPRQTTQHRPLNTHTHTHYTLPPQSIPPIMHGTCVDVGVQEGEDGRHAGGHLGGGAVHPGAREPADLPVGVRRVSVVAGVKMHSTPWGL